MAQPECGKIRLPQAAQDSTEHNVHGGERQPRPRHGPSDAGDAPHGVPVRPAEAEIDALLPQRLDRQYEGDPIGRLRRDRRARHAHCRDEARHAPDEQRIEHRIDADAERRDPEHRAHRPDPFEARSHNTRGDQRQRSDQRPPQVALAVAPRHALWPHSEGMEIAAGERNARNACRRREAAHPQALDHQGAHVLPLARSFCA
mmetsp:Transcript_7723/g.29012  ORF Transcript_7723/g.29012 Transcript_7723/m.29012 type:complete len:202 (+) Transcript_7723:666-1271(+)